MQTRRIVVILANMHNDNSCQEVHGSFGRTKQHKQANNMQRFLKFPILSPLLDSISSCRFFLLFCCILIWAARNPSALQAQVETPCLIQGGCA